MMFFTVGKFCQFFEPSLSHPPSDWKIEIFIYPTKNTNKMTINVLYLGMAYDIMAPLLLVPDVDIIFAIDIYDETYGCLSWDEQKDEMRIILTEGSDKHSQCRHFHDHDRINRLPGGPATIISDEDEDKCWTLKFIYDGKLRTLIYYHHTDFCDPWPTTISDCAHIMSMGVCIVDESNSEEENRHLRAMFERSCSQGTKTKYYALTFMHEHFPEQVTIYNANADVEGESINWTEDLDQYMLEY